MSSVEIDITANTKQAEKAINGLVKDVDKLTKKAQSSGSANKDKEAQIRQQHQPLRRITQDSSKALDAFKGALGEVTSKLGELGDGFSKITNLLLGLSSLKNLTGLNPVGTTMKSVRGILARGGRERISSGVLKLARNENYKINYLKSAYENGAWVPATMDPAKLDTMLAESNKHLQRRQQVAQNVRRRSVAERAVGYDYQTQKSRPTTPLQRRRLADVQWNRGGMLGGINVGKTSLLGLNTTKLSGAINLARSYGSYALTGVAPIAGSGAIATAALPVAAVGGLLMNASSNVDKGRQKYEGYQQLNASLGTLIKNLTGSTIGASKLAKQVQKIGELGVVPIDELKEGANRLLLAFKGNTVEAAKWTQILADISAGTGESVSSLSELITRAKQFGEVDFEVFNQLNEKGIPVLDALEGKFGKTREEIQKAFSEGKVAAEDFIVALEKAYEVTLKGSNAAQGQVTLTQLQQRYENLSQEESSKYTEGYDRVKSQQVQRRIDWQEARNSDITLAANAAGAGSALARLTNVVDDITFGFKKFGQGLVDFGGKLFNWDDAGANQMTKDMIMSWESGMANLNKVGQDKASSAQLANLLSQGKEYAAKLTQIAGADFDGLVTDSARNAAIVIQKQLSELEKMYEAAIQREKEAAKKAEQEKREQTATNNRKTYLEEQALKNNDIEGYLNVKGTSKEKLLRDIQANKDIIAQGKDFNSKATETLEQLNEILDNVLKMEDAINEKSLAAAKKAEERQYKLQEERLNNRVIEEYKDKWNPLQKQAIRGLFGDSFFNGLISANDKQLVRRRMTEGEIPFEESLQRIREKERELAANESLTRSDREIILSDFKRNERIQLNEMISEQSKRIREEEARANNAKETGILMNTNAWGSTGTMYTNFNQAVKIDESQFKYWKELTAVSEKYMAAIALYRPTAQ